MKHNDILIEIQSLGGQLSRRGFLKLSGAAGGADEVLRQRVPVQGVQGENKQAGLRRVLCPQVGLFDGLNYLFVAVARR